MPPKKAMSESKKFAKILKMTHTEQAVWFLNGFWSECKGDNDLIWDYTHFMMEIQMGKKTLYGSKKTQHDDDVKEGCDVDQFQAHRFLEHVGETKTASALRKELATIDINKDNRLSLTEYLMSKYSKNITEIVNASQGGSSAELEAAEAKLAEIVAEQQALQSKLEDEKAALAAAVEQEEKAQAAKEVADKAHEEQVAADLAVQAAEEAVRIAVEELAKQEAEYKRKIEKAEAGANDESTSAMKRAKSNNILQQLKSEDPLPLSRAKITQGSALKKAKKESKAAAKATALAAKQAEAAAAAAEAAEAARLAGEAAAAEVEAAVVAIEGLFADAQAKFEELKQAGGAANGKIFWMEKEMAEIQKFMPAGRKAKKKKN